MNNQLIFATLTTGLLCVAVYFVGACGKSAPPAAVAIAQQFTCPMHPEVASNAPGVCPKCSMKLVETMLSSEPAK